MSDSSASGKLATTALQVRDVMTPRVVSAHEGATFKEIVTALRNHGVHSLPVIDDDRRVLGVVTNADLLVRVGHGRPVPRHHRIRARLGTYKKMHARTARELMTSPPITTTPETSISAAARMLTDHRIRTVPVVDRTGHLLGMVSRADLIKVFLRSDADIRGDVVHDVVRPALFPNHAGVRVSVVDGVVTLSGRVDTAPAAQELVYEALKVPGVVDVQDNLEFDVLDGARFGL
jgi:CBS domain-containing protein